MAHLPSSSLERAINYDYTHPERHYKGLTLALENDEEIYKQRNKQGIFGLHCRHPNQELCWSCGWSTYMELTSSYGSRLKIMHVRENIGLWAMGSQWIIRDQPNDATLGNDYITQQFLRAQPGLNVPLVEEMRLLSKPTDKIHFTLMSRAQGVTLDSIWGTLTPEQKLGYKDQLADSIRQIRQFTAPVAQKVDGSALDDVLIGYCGRRHPPTCKKMGYTTEEWFESIAEELRLGLAKIHKTEDPTTIEAKLQELIDNFPKAEPYVLTHADLNLTNIIVKDDRIEAIIDWEMSGYYPWWAERWLSIMGSDKQSCELFESLWADLSPEMDEGSFSKQVFLKVAPVIEAWEKASNDIDHPGKRTELLRPGFCQCKPYAGGFTTLSLGQRYEHKIKDKNLSPPSLEGI
jgi:hypothetical protein